jgi:hypothetical protein
MATDDTIFSWDANANHAPVTNGAQAETTSANMRVLAFNESTTESARFIGYMPGQYDNVTDFKFELLWKFKVFQGASETCAWGVTVAKLASAVDSIDSITWGTEVELLDPEPGGAGLVKTATLLVTRVEADSIIKNTFFAVRVRRNAALGSPTTGDSHFIGLAMNLQ